MEGADVGPGARSLRDPGLRRGRAHPRVPRADHHRRRCRPPAHRIRRHRAVARRGPVRRPRRGGDPPRGRHVRPAVSHTLSRRHAGSQQKGCSYYPFSGRTLKTLAYLAALPKVGTALYTGEIPEEFLEASIRCHRGRLSYGAKMVSSDPSSASHPPPQEGVPAPRSWPTAESGARFEGGDATGSRRPCASACHDHLRRRRTPQR